MKDRIFIFISVVLIILFAISALENVDFFSTRSKDIVRAKPPEAAEPRTSKILTMLEERGLEPRKARYYKVIDE